MNRKFIFVFILLITLFMVDSRPLKRATKFKKCRNGPPQLEVKLSPDPLEPGEDNTFTISGKLDYDINDSATTFIAFVILVVIPYILIILQLVILDLNVQSLPEPNLLPTQYFRYHQLHLKCTICTLPLRMMLMHLLLIML